MLLAVALALARSALWNFQRLPIDAVPDITNVQVQINTEAPGYSPLEVEQRITFPIETAMAGLPRLEYTRSLSRYGLSQVTVVFEDGTDIYFARQLVDERLQEAQTRLPPGIEPEMGPIATGLGEIFMCTVERRSRRARRPTARRTTPTDLRTVRTGSSGRSCAPCPASPRSTPSAATRSSIHVTPRPAAAARVRPHARRISCRRSSATTPNVGAGYIERNGSQLLVRAPGQVGGLERRRDSCIDRDARRHARSACGDVADVGARARSCAPAPPRRTARRSCSAPSSC